MWALDGSVEYFRSKHIVLFILALFAVIASLLFSILILIMGFKNNLVNCKCRLSQIQATYEFDQIQGEVDAEEDFEQGWKAICLAQLHRCKSIFNLPLPLHDALFAPLNNKHKYWLGLLLFVRVALLVLFSTTSDVQRKLNLFILLLVATVLLLYLAWNNVYNDRRIQMLEGLALANVVFFSSGMFYTNLETWKSVIACTSIGIAFVQFLGILFHCIIEQCFKNQLVPTQAVAAAPIHDVEQADSPQGQLLDTSDWFETQINDANGDGVDDEREPLLAHANH